MLSNITIIACVCYAIYAELLLNNFTSIKDREQDLLAFVMSYKPQYVMVYKILESRMREPKRSMTRTIIGDFFRVYLPVFSYLIFLGPEILPKALPSLPSFVIILSSIYSVDDEVIHWVYAKNKYVKSVYMFTYGLMKCVAYFMVFKNLSVHGYLFAFFYITMNEGLTVPIVNTVEDVILINYTKLKKEINMTPFLVSLNAYLSIHLIVIVGEYLKSNGFNTYGHNPLFNIDHFMKAGCLFVLIFNF